MRGKIFTVQTIIYPTNSWGNQYSLPSQYIMIGDFTNLSQDYLQLFGVQFKCAKNKVPYVQGITNCILQSNFSRSTNYFPKMKKKMLHVQSVFMNSIFQILLFRDLMLSNIIILGILGIGTFYALDIKCWTYVYQQGTLLVGHFSLWIFKLNN